MDQSSAWLQSLMNIQDRRQLFVFDVDQTHRLISRVHVQRRYSRHRIAHVAHFFNCHNGLIFKYRAVVRFDAFVLEYVVACNHCQDSRNFERLGSVDMFDARVR